MQQCHTLGLLACLAMSACRPAAPDVALITARHLEAVGGAQALRAMSSWRMAGTLTLPDKSVRRFAAERKRPNLCRSESTGPDGVLVRAYDGKTAWRQQAGGAVEVLSGSEAQERIESCDFDEDPFLDFADRGIALKNVGVADVNGRKALKVEVTRRDGRRSIGYIDANTWLDVRWDYYDRDGSVTIQHLSDRRSVAGISTASTWVMTDADGSAPLRSHADTVEIDVAIPDQRFSPPGQ